MIFRPTESGNNLRHSALQTRNPSFGKSFELIFNSDEESLLQTLLNFFPFVGNVDQGVSERAKMSRKTGHRLSHFPDIVGKEILHLVFETTENTDQRSYANNNTGNNTGQS